MFDLNPHPMWIFDKQSYKILKVNQATIRQYEYSEEELLQSTIQKLRLPDQSHALALIDQDIQGETINSREVRHVSKTGNVFDVEIISYPIKFFERDVRLVHVYNITAKKSLE